MKNIIKLPHALAVQLALITAATFMAIASFASMSQVQEKQNLESVEITVIPVQGNVYMLVGAGGNTTAQVGDDGVLVVDTQFAELSDKIITAIRRLSNKPIRHIINTSIDPDHVGGNEHISNAGARVGPPTGEERFTGRGAQVFANLNVLNRMSAPTGRVPPVPFGLWPTDTFAGSRDLYFNNEGIRLIHQPAAHTDGDVMVYFRRSDVISTGDVFVKTSYPVVDLKLGGSIKGIIDALNNIIDITIPREKQEGGTMVIPGHGRLCDEADVVEYRDMVTIIRDRIQYMINKGMTLEQVKAARPTLDYDPAYGAKTPSWTTEMFVEAVYRSLSQNSK